MKSILVLFSLVVAANCYFSYRNYKLYDVVPNEQQYEAFAEWEYVDGVDFFRLTAPNRSSKVLIKPELIDDFERFLTRNNIVHSVMSNDYEVEIEKERENIVENRKTKSAFSVEGAANFEVYWSFDEMKTYLNSMVTSYPSRMTLENLSYSPEGRPIYAVKITSGATFGHKPIIAMETGMHAREWATPPTAFYLINQLLTNSSVYSDLLEKVDWLIIPMQNPDGYEFSRLTQRLWRQNRRQITPTCIGADLNRNFEYSWRAATATQTCGSLTYPGPFAFSEPEDFHLHNVVSRYVPNVRMYLSVHTFGDLVLFPWGYRDNPGPLPQTNELIHVGNLWRDAILAATGKDYLVVNSLEYFGNINGAVDDHMLAIHQANITFTLELTNGHGFLYPEQDVFALSQETFIGYREMAIYIGKTYGRK